MRDRDEKYDYLIVKVAIAIFGTGLAIYLVISAIEEIKIQRAISEIQKFGEENLGQIKSNKSSKLENENRRLIVQIADLKKELRIIKSENMRIRSKYEFVLELEKQKANIEWSE